MQVLTPLRSQMSSADLAQTIDNNSSSKYHIVSKTPRLSSRKPSLDDSSRISMQSDLSQSCVSRTPFWASLWMLRSLAGLVIERLCAPIMHPVLHSPRLTLFYCHTARFCSRQALLHQMSKDSIFALGFMTAPVLHTTPGAQISDIAASEHLYCKAMGSLENTLWES